MMLPTVILIILNNYLPMFGVIVAFKNVNYVDGVWGSPWSGLENFKFLFTTRDAWIITRNTLAYNAIFIIMTLFFALAFAVMLNEVRVRLLAKFYQSLIFLPYFLSAVVISYLAFSFLGEQHGYLNNVVLKAFGIDPISWYAEPKYWMFILPIIHVWKSVGYYMVIYLAAIIGIDEEYYEAAVLDGASKWQQITKITIPLITPIIVIMTLLQIGRIFYADFGLFLSSAS